MTDSPNRDCVTCEGRENDYADDDTPVVRLRKIAANLICYSRNAADKDAITESFGFALEAMDQYADHLLSVANDLDAPAAGTSAYQMVADTATAQLQTTETLIHMVAATVLMKMMNYDVPIEQNTVEVTFSPTDMDEMHRRYEMTAKHDGMLTTVHIKPRPDEIAPPRPPIEANLERKPESLMTQDDGEGPFKPQAAPHVYDRPIWAIRFYVHGKPKLHQMDNQGAAERQVRSYLPVEGDPEAVIENRFCLHVGCPADRCLLADAEVTSE